MITLFLGIYIVCGIFYLSRFLYNHRDKFLQSCEDNSASYPNMFALITSFFIMLCFWVVLLIVEIFNREV